ncbi:HlyD family secretion protein [Chromobacterium sp. ASV23]|uniref:HlyD family secretion protein n=1 Tax=Chromobacterium sp. ASV23 TaxID=2795110 RepID=UPI0018EA3D92|nr:HlyD family efflux transporter periplasmic adaptor subunit [Chromobacterium sp. ASV23]
MVNKNTQNFPGIVLAAMAALLATGCDQRKPDGYQGYVEGDFVYMSTPYAGKMTNLHVRRGQQVASHGLLFAVDATEETYAMQHAHAQYESADASLKDLKKGRRPAEINAIRAQLAQAQASAKRSDQQLARDEELFKASIISQAQIDSSRAARAADQAKVEEIRSQLDTAALPARQDQIQSQEAQVQGMRASYGQWQYRVQQKSVTASAQATVVDIFYREGEWVQSNAPVMKLLPVDNVKIKFFVPENDLQKVRAGQSLRLSCDGCQAGLAAVVDYIAPDSEYTPPMIYSNESRSKLVYLIEARPDKATARALRVGQPVEVLL